MRTALVSDIHGNFEGLVAVLNDVARQGCDRILCLGDLVDGGAGNEEVVAEIRRRGIICVRGNHDENNDAGLLPETARFLRSLPEEIIEDEIVYTHISPGVKKTKINSAENAWSVFESAKFHRLFVGHTHVPYLFGAKNGAVGSATVLACASNIEERLDREDRYIVCVAPLGYARDRALTPRYTIYDSRWDSIEVRAVEGVMLNMDPDESSPWNAFWDGR